MHIVEPCELNGRTQGASEHYAALLNIIEQARSIGFELDERLPLIQELSATNDLSLASLCELIGKTRKKLYQQMMEFEFLDSDLATLQSELSEKIESPEDQAVRLSLV